jgi:hypothetical protein
MVPFEFLYGWLFQTLLRWDWPEERVMMGP